MESQVNKIVPSFHISVVEFRLRLSDISFESEQRGTFMGGKK